MGSPAYVTLICQGATRATRLAGFPADEPLELPQETKRLQWLSERVAGAAPVYTSPALSARQTAAALGLEAVVQPLLRDCDYGSWRGLRLTEVHAREPESIENWMSDQSATPHGGESLLAVRQRALAWLESLEQLHGAAAAITNNAVIRHVMLGVLAAPVESFWRIDIAPLSYVQLASNGRRWVLRASSAV